MDLLVCLRVIHFSDCLGQMRGEKIPNINSIYGISVKQILEQGVDKGVIKRG